MGRLFSLSLYDHLICCFNSPNNSWILPVEIVFSLFYIALCSGSIATTKFRRSSPSQIYMAAAQAVVVFMLFLDPILALSRANYVGAVPIRFGVPFRPVRPPPLKYEPIFISFIHDQQLLIMLWSRRIKEVVSEVTTSFTVS